MSPFHQKNLQFGRAIQSNLNMSYLITEPHPSIRITIEFLNRLPISTSLLVIINNGTIENGNAKAKKTCELIISVFNAVCSRIVPCLLVIITQINTGITEIQTRK